MVNLIILDFWIAS